MVVENGGKKMNINKEIKCPNCSWEWNLEVDDKNPHLCHKCGYDSILKDFDMLSLKKWQEKNDHPFDEHIKEGLHIRTFREDVNREELVWHRDREDRIVFPINETDWKIQFDNQIPINIEPKNPIFIESGKYHRLIKGTKDLNFKIYKTNFDDKSNMKNTIYETFKVFLENDFFLIDNKKNNKK